MPVVLHILGALIGVAGLLMTGFAIPIRDFSFGNTLILAGAIAIVGGVILLGLGSALRELRKLNRSLQNGALPTRPDTDGKPARSPRVTGPIPQPAAPMPRPARSEPRPEPRIDAAQEDFEREPEFDPEPAPAAPAGQRPSIFALVRGAKTEHFEIDETESVPLSPSPAPRAPAVTRERAGAAAESSFDARPEPRVESRADTRGASPAALASRTAARIDMPRPVPELPRADMERTAERPQERNNERSNERHGRNLFDSVWPNEGQREPALNRAPSERLAAERHAERPMFAPAEPELRKDAFDLAHAAVKEAVEGLMIAEPKEEAPARQEPKLEVRPDPKPVTILKSGVIDGMAYTLYTDGSIEAQLPSGLMRFASIDDLRTYLERSA
jgi:hypothetical protein